MSIAYSCHIIAQDGVSGKFGAQFAWQRPSTLTLNSALFPAIIPPFLTMSQAAYELKAKIHFLVDPAEFKQRKRGTKDPYLLTLLLLPAILVTNPLVLVIVAISLLDEFKSLTQEKNELITRLQKQEKQAK